MNSKFERLKRLVETNHGTHRGWVRYLLGQVEGVTGPRERFRSITPENVGRLVFVCLGNINRSAFAHAVAANNAVKCISLGLSTTTGAPATQMAQQVASEFGISLQLHTATDISQYEHRHDDLLLAMELRHAHRLVARGIPAERVALLGHWARPIRYHIHDPEKLSYEYYRSCFGVIFPAVTNLANQLHLADSPSIRR